jgi:hypothetical protein
MTEIVASPVPSSEGAGLRRCTRCQTEKPAEEFHWRKKAEGKRQPDCKACVKSRGKGADYTPVPKVERDKVLDGVAYRQCVTCEVWWDLDGGYSWANMRSGEKHRTCRQCAAKATKRYNEKNPERVRQSWRRYRRATYMMGKYGLTDEDYWRMYEEQGEVCAICGKPDPAVHPTQERPLHIDHDHTTGAVRALLCRGCNMGIGAMGDDPARVRAAAEYLERHGAGYELGRGHGLVVQPAS